MTDPYQSPTAAAAPPTDGSNGQAAAILGILSLVLSMIGPCTCYLPNVFAVAIGIAAVVTARKVLAQGASGESLAYARVGQISGIVASAWSTMLCLLIALYVVLYAAIIVLAVAADGM